MLTGIEVNFSLIVNIIRTLIDLLLVWYILYLGISMFKQNMRTMQLFKGVLIILLIKLVTSVLGLSTMSYLVDTVLTWGIIAIIVIFQPEIRSLLEKMGQTKRHWERIIIFPVLQTNRRSLILSLPNLLKVWIISLKQVYALSSVTHTVLTPY